MWLSIQITQGAFKSIAVGAAPRGLAVTGLRWGLVAVFSEALQASATRVVCVSLAQLPIVGSSTNGLERC